MIVGDVIDLECAAIDVARHHVGGAGAIHRPEAGNLSVQPDGAHEGSPDDAVPGDVVGLEPAGVRVRICGIVG